MKYLKNDYNLFSADNISFQTDLAEMKLMIHKVVLNQRKIMEILENMRASNLQSDTYLNVSSIQKTEFESHLNSNYPLINLDIFRHTNKLLNNNIYYDLMVNYFTTI